MRTPLSEENPDRTGRTIGQRQGNGDLWKIWGIADPSLGEPMSKARTRASTSKGVHGGLEPRI